MELIQTDGFPQLLEQISGTYTQGRVRAVQTVNTQLTETYWQVGRHIVEFEQAGSLRAEYGKALLNQLAADLGLRHGKGFSRSNLIYMRLFYLRYPISEKPSHLLSWSHYETIIKRAEAESRTQMAENNSIANLSATVKGELDRLSRVFTSCVRQLAQTLAARVIKQRMGASWN